MGLFSFSSRFPFPRKQPAVVGPEGGPLTQEHLTQIGEARLRANGFLRAAVVAHRQMVGLVLMGVITTLLAFFGGFSITAFVMGVWMTVAGVVEGVGEGQIRRLKPGVFKMLCINQLALAAMLVIISGWWVLRIKLGWEDQQLSQMTAGVSQLLGGAGSGSSQQIKSAFHLVAYAAYGSVGLLGLLEGGFTYLYYRYRGKQMDLYLNDTAAWILHLHQTGTL